MELIVRCLEKIGTIGVRKDCYQPGGKKSFKYKLVCLMSGRKHGIIGKGFPLMLGIEQMGPGQVLSH